MTIVHPNYPIGGYDISAHQASLEPEIARRKISFALFRAGNGQYDSPMKDRRYDNHVSSISRVSTIPWGSYFIMVHYKAGEEQAKAYENIVESRQHGDLPIFVDLELENYPDGKVVDKRTITKTTLEFLEYADQFAQRHTRSRRCGIYSSAGWWNVYIDQSQISKFRLSERPLWVANYVTSLYAKPLIPSGWMRWDFWQFSADKPTPNRRAKEFGISGSASVDMDVFRGTPQEFESYFHVKPHDVNSFIEKPIAIKIKSRAYVRMNPSMSGIIVGSANPGSTWPVVDLVPDNKGALWCKITEGLYISYGLGEPIYI